MDDGYDVSIDYLGELSKTEEDCEQAKEQYIQIIKMEKEIGRTNFGQFILFKIGFIITISNLQFKQ